MIDKAMLCTLKCLGILAAVMFLTTAPAARAQISFVTTQSNSSNNNISLTLPASPQAGDLMVAHVATNATGSAITPSVTWSTLRTDYAPSGCTPGSTCTIKVQIFYRFFLAGDGTNYNFNVGGGAKVSGGIMVFRGVDTSNPFLADVASASASPTSTVTAPAIGSTMPAGAYLLALFAVAGESTYTASPAAYTTRYTANLAKGGAGHPNLRGTTRGPLAAAESPAAVTATASVATYNTVGHHLALRVGGFVHYGITAPAGTSFATCNTITVNIKGHNVSHTTVTPPAGTIINLSTSIGTGTWQTFSGAAGDLGTSANFVPSGSDNGQATYTWSGTETELQVRLRVTTATSFTVNVTDGVRSEDSSEDPTFTVADSTVMVTTDGVTTGTIATQIAGKPSNTGWNGQTLYLKVMNSSGKSPDCTAEYQGQTVDVQFAAVCENPSTCSAAAGAAFEVLNNASSYVSIAKSNGPAAPVSYTAVTLTFDATTALAPLVFRYGDAGQAKLYVRVPLPAPPANKVASGSSNSFVVRPFGFAFRGANVSTSVQHGTTENATVLAAAGDNFTMTLGAYKWASGQDVNNDGIPDSDTDLTSNGLTPSFAASTAVSVSGNLPGVATGAMSRDANCASAATVASNEWSGGAATVTDWCYSEAGNPLLTATTSDYLSVTDADIAGSSGFDGTGAGGGYVGRFRPKHFALDTTLTPPTLTNRSASSCSPASSFTYMGEDIGLTFRLTAQNRQGQTTQNYQGVYAKLDPTTASVFGFGARSGATNLTARLAASYAGATPAWTAGVLNVAAPDRLLLRVNRATPDTPDGPYTSVAFGMAPSDSDTVAMNAFDFDADGNAVNERKSLGVTTEVRFGRLRIGNANGSQVLALSVPMETQYWNGTAFITNTADSCTTLAVSNIAMSGYTQNLSACETSLTVGAFSNGRSTLRLSAPGSGNNGAALLTPNVGSSASGSTCVAGTPTAVTAGNRAYLLGRWDNTDQGADTLVYDDNPVGRATFGVYRGSEEFIYNRENF